MRPFCHNCGGPPLSCTVCAPHGIQLLPPDSTLECRTCSVTREVNFGQCLEAGWPRCCGETMRLIKTTVSIALELKRIIPDLDLWRTAR